MVAVGGGRDRLAGSGDLMEGRRYPASLHGHQITTNTLRQRRTRLKSILSKH